MLVYFNMIQKCGAGIAGGGGIYPAMPSVYMVRGRTICLKNREFTRKALFLSYAVKVSITGGQSNAPFLIRYSDVHGSTP